MCYLVERRRSALKGVGINRREPQNRGALGLSSLERGATDPLKTSPLTICVTTSNLVILRQRVCAYIGKGTPKIGERWALAPLRQGRG